MREIILDATGWTRAEDFYAVYLPAVGAPDWHGHNLDALWDSLRGGYINQVNPPFRVHIIGAADLPDDCRLFLARVASLIADARADGLPVDLIVE